MERLMSDGYPFIFQLRRNDLSLYILVNKEYVSDTCSYADELANIVQQYL